MNKLAKRAWFALALAAVLAVGLVTIFVKYFLHASDWVTFQSSPHVYSNGVLDSGVITDRNGTTLLDASDGLQYAESSDLRKATLHLLGDRAGNISAFLLNEYSDELIGFNSLSGTYHLRSGSGKMRLTISAEAQKAAYLALDGRKGTVGVYNYKTGEILCAVSAPSFDPDNVPDISADPDAYDGVYFNRFFHGSYPPGSVFKLVTATAALECIDNIESRTFYCEGSVDIDGQTVVCNGWHGEIGFEQALAKSCNVAFSEIAVELGADTLSQYAEQLGITDSLSFDGLTTSSGHFDLSQSDRYQTGWAGVGQFTDQINPCQFMTLMGAIANGGVAAQPYLVAQVEYGKSTQYEAESRSLERVMTQKTAERLAGMMHYSVVNIYGEWYFSGLYAGAKSGTAEVAEGEEPNAVFAGFVQDETYPLAFVVVVENGGSGSSTCTPIVKQVLDACIVSMN